MELSANVPDTSASSQSILAVVVLYKMSLSQSATVQTLLKAKHLTGEAPIRLAITVYDNTPGGQDPGPIPAGMSYVRLPENPGLAAAYNDALVRALKEGYEWLLTLDQDTTLPPTFLSTMNSYAKQYVDFVRVAAIVPRISDQGRLISPFRFVGGFLPLVLPSNSEGISKRFTSALNSTSLVRVSALQEIGGYDSRFPLHNSDTSLYHRLDKIGKRVVVASEILVNHELAILSRGDRLSPERYRKMLLDESIFWDLHMGLLGRTERLVRLAGRFCMGYLKKEDARFRNIAFAEIRRRLVTSKRTRLKLIK